MAAHIIKLNSIALYANLERQLPMFKQMLRKVYSDWDDDQLESYIRNEINILDPTGDEASFTGWIIKQLQSGQISLPQDGEQVKQILRYYQLNRDKFNELPKDIYQIDFNTLKKRIAELEEKGTLREKSLKEQYEEIKEGVEEVYNDGEYRVLKCTTPEAVSRFGRGTMWCTTDLEKAEDYLSQGPIFRIFRNGQPYASLSYLGVKDKQDNDFDFTEDRKLKDILNELYQRDIIPKDYFYVVEDLSQIDENMLRNLTDFQLEAIASNDDISAELLDKIADIAVERKAVGALVSIVHNPNVSYATIEKILDGLGDEANFDIVRAYIAHDPDLPMHLFEKLLNSSPYVLENFLLENRNIPKEILLKLVKHPDFVIAFKARKILEEKYGYSIGGSQLSKLEALLDRLTDEGKFYCVDYSKDDWDEILDLMRGADEQLWFYLADYCGGFDFQVFPDRLLQEMVKNTDFLQHYISYIRTLEFNDRFDVKFPYIVQKALAEAPDPDLRVMGVPYITYDDLLRKLAQDPDVGVRQTVAFRGGDNPEDVLKILMQDPDPAVRWALLDKDTDKPVPHWVVEALAQDEDETVSHRAKYLLSFK